MSQKTGSKCGVAWMIRLILLLVCCAVISPSCAPPPPPASKNVEQTLYLAVAGDPKSFNPIIAKETSTTDVTERLMGALTELQQPSLEITPALAESWEYDETGTVWTFHLKKGLQWSDGVPLTAFDVVFTIRDLIYNEEIPTSTRDVFSVDGRPIEVDAPDSYTVVFSLPDRFAPFLLLTSGLEIMPEHKLRPALDAGTFNSTWGVGTPPEEIVGCGPFRLKEFVPGQKIVCERNPYYWRNGENGEVFPKLEQIVMLVVPDQNATVLKFKSGEIDYLGVRGEDYTDILAGQEAGNYTVIRTGPSLSSMFICFNQNPNGISRPQLDWFTDVEFRRAIAHAVDKQTMIQNVYDNLAYPQHAAESPALEKYFNAGVRQYPYDLERSKAILEEAGYRDRDGDGIREDQNGNPLEFTLVTNTESTQRVAVGTIMVDDLQKLGLQVYFVPVQFNALVTRMTSTFDWEAIIIGFSGVIDPNSSRNVWHSGGQLHMWNPRQENPATPWEAELDRLFDEGAKELDDLRRREIYRNYQEIIAEQLPVIYTVTPEKIYATRNKIANLEPTPYSLLHNLDEWYMQE